MIFLFKVIIDYLNEYATPISDLAMAHIFIGYVVVCVQESACVYVRLCACMCICVRVCEGVHVCAFAPVLLFAVDMLVCAYLCERM